MASAKQEELPPAAPLDLGFRPQSPRSDPQPEQLAGALQDLRVEEGKAEEECGSEESEEKEGGDGKRKKAKRSKTFYPRRPGVPDCIFFVKKGKCAFGRKCRFNHPWVPKNNKDQVAENDAAKEIIEENCSEDKKLQVKAEEDKHSKEIREERNSETKEIREERNSETVENMICKAVIDDDAKEIRQVNCSEKVGKLRCKYFDAPGGCKYGSVCNYNHSEEKKVPGQVELNFLGLPLRPGGKECPFYMKNGSCKYSTNCRYHHPDPSASTGSDMQLGQYGAGYSPLHVSAAPEGNDMQSGQYGTGYSPLHVSAASQMPSPLHAPHITPASSFPYIHGPPPYAHPMPTASQLPLHSPLHLGPGWNGYQPLIDPSFSPDTSGRYVPLPSIQGPPRTSNDSKHQMQNEDAEFPQRPGQLDCPYYMKSGNCKYKSGCKYNHPKDRLTSASILSPKGLPLRPGKTVCTYYSRHGICKFGPTCKYDHPMDHVPSQTTAQ